MTPEAPAGTTEGVPRALNGLRVLDIGHWLAGPFGATLLADQTLQQRAPVTAELNDIARPWIAARTCEEVMARFVEFGVPAMPVYSARDILEDPHYAAREDIVTVDDPELGPVRQPAPLPKLSRTPGQVFRPAPFHGEHNAEI